MGRLFGAAAEQYEDELTTALTCGNEKVSPGSARDTYSVLLAPRRDTLDAPCAKGNLSPRRRIVVRRICYAPGPGIAEENPLWSGTMMDQLRAWFTAANVLPVLLLLLGFLGRSVWDILTKRRESLRELRLKSRIDRLERQLAEFYWPIYLRLIQNEATWEHLLKSDAPGLLKAFEKVIVLPNHVEIVARLQKSAHLADADYEFRKLIAEYLHHVAAYQSLRAAGDDRLPAQLQVPWPQKLNREFERRTLRLQNEYDCLLKRPESLLANPDAPSMFRDLEREAEDIMQALGLKPRT